MKAKLFFFLFLISSFHYPQTDIDTLYMKTFQENNGYTMTNFMQQAIDYYPLSNGDFWEYIVIDTTTFFGQNGLRHSVIKEVIGDTIMSNSITYKILRWEKCSNSSNEQPWFEFHRKDTSGNIYIYYQGEDRILYQFNKTVGDTFTSHYPGYYWRVDRKYKVTGFDKILNAIDFGLYKRNSSIVTRIERVIENFGLTYYSGEIDGYFNIPEGSYFGGIINDTTYGYLLARKQEIDWSEFYPLHVGDFWKYEGFSGIFQTSTIIRVLKDTIINQINYKKVESLHYPWGYKNSSYLRIEENVVYEWQRWNSKTVRIFNFSSCLGDTSESSFNNLFWRVDNKNYDTIKIFLYPDLTFQGKYFAKDLGLVEETFEGGRNYLIGALIDGRIYGDTTSTDVEGPETSPVVYNLFQNYPNPFNSETTIKYIIPKTSHVLLKVFDLLGKEVHTLVNEEKNAGEYKVLFDAGNLASGVYLYRLETHDYSIMKKLILLK